MMSRSRGAAFEDEWCPSNIIEPMTADIDNNVHDVSNRGIEQRHCPPCAVKFNFMLYLLFLFSTCVLLQHAEYRPSP